MKKVIAISASLMALAGAVVFMPSGCSTTHSNLTARYPLTDEGRPAALSLNKGAERLDAGYHYTMGLVFHEKGKHRLAIQEFKDAVAADPRYVEAYNAMGITYDAMGRYREAADAYLSALEHDMTLDYVYNNLGWNYLLQERTNMAEASFRQALRLHPDNTRYLNNLGYALTLQGRYGEAFEVFESAVGKAEAHLTIARLCFKNGKYAEAEDHFARARAIAYNGPATDKEMTAAANLAQIHKVPEKKAPAEAPDMLAAAPAAKVKRDTDSGLQAFPAGVLQDAGVSEIRLTEVAAEVVTVATESEALVLADLEPPTTSPMAPSPAVKASDLKPVEEKKPASEAAAASDNQSEDEPRMLLSMVRPVTEKTPRIHIEVTNGNGVRHMARQVGTYLRPKGFVPMYLANAKHFNHDQTRIFYTKGYRDDAKRLAEVVPGKPQVAEVESIRNGHAHISLLIGKDIVPVSSIFKKG